MNFIALDAYSDLLDSAGHFLSPKSAAVISDSDLAILQRALTCPAPVWAVTLTLNARGSMRSKEILCTIQPLNTEVSG
jgi:hypothetical protein